jgi:beta-glucosidase
VARNYKEASLFSVAAGMDMNMHGPDFYDFVVALVREKKLSMDRVDEACSKILYAKFQLGLFENRFVDTSKIGENVFIKSHLDKAEEIADNAITLLKNNDLLPINNSNSKRILVTGPNAHNNTILGDWHFEQPAENVVTIFEGIQEIGEKYNHKVDYFDSGIKIRNIKDSKITATSEMSTNYDHVFVVVGDNSLRYTWEGGKSFRKTAGENMARSFLGLPGKQLDLVKAIYEKNKNMTVVYVSGKPISEPWIEDNIKSIIHAWEPGSMGGKSLGKIVFGMINPSGKMPITTARSVGQLIMVYNHKPTNYIHKYAFEKTKPLYPFGYGLSYTTFSISEPTLSTSEWNGSGKVHVEVDVKNTGEREGMETVQLYIRDVFSSVTRPVLELKGYKKVNLAPGEMKRMSFSLALDDFAFYDREMKYKAEKGDFNIFVGNSSNLYKLKKTTLELTKNIYINEN